MIIEESPDKTALYNEDGTLYDPPDSYYEYIKEAFPMPENCRDECRTCDKCHRGGFFKIPDSEKYRIDVAYREIKEYHRVHNPEMYELCYNVTIG